MAKFIQLFRNQLNAPFESKAAAKAALEANNIDPQVLKDGMPILARYLTNGPGSDIKTLFGIAHNNGENAVVTVFDSGSIDELDSTITADADKYFSGVAIVDGKLVQTASTQANVDAAHIVDYVENTATTKADTNLASGDTIAQALAKVEQRVDIEETARIAAIEGLDYSGVTNETKKVVTDVTETDGVVSAVTTDVKDLVITAITTSDAKVAANDSIGTAFGKLQGQIDAMDLETVNVAGQPIVAIAESDGKVTASAGTITASAVTIVDTTSAFTATEVEGALAELAAKTAVNNLSSPLSSITITTAATGTSIDVNVDGTTIVIDNTNGKVKSNLTIEKLDTGLPANVKERYILRYGDNTTPIGDAIDIYKDSSLVTAYLGHVDDTVDPDTGVISSGGTGDAAICLVYYTVDTAATYQLVAVNVETFLQESEFKDGLTADSTTHEVSVLIDTTSEKVITGDSSATGDVLSVSASGVKVNNIQNAINYKVSTLDATVSGSDTDNFVTVTVAEVDGKLTGVTVATDDIASDTALQAEIAARKDVDGINGDAYTANTTANYITGATSLNNADVLLDGTIATLSGKSVTDVEMTGGTAAIAAADDGTKKITINTDGSKIKLDGYTTATTGDVAATDTVNQAISKLENKISAGTSDLQAEVDTIEAAVGLGTGGTHVQSSGKYTSGASTVEGEISSLNDQLVTVSTTYISSAITGNNGVTVVENAAAADSGKTVTVSLKLDANSASDTEANAQYASATGNALKITDGETGGLFLDSSWDCGFYSVGNNNG